MSTKQQVLQIPSAVLLILFSVLTAACLRSFGAAAQPLTGTETAVNLLLKYPTKLTEGDTSADRARPSEFTSADIFRVSRFDLKAGKTVRIEIGAADLGIGHCADGAVWAALIPRQNGELTSGVTNRPEAISHVWFRFHPAQIARLFPPDTVFTGGNTNLFSQIRRVANHKIFASWHAGGHALIPEPKDMTVDVDTKDGLRRFISVDTEANTADYWPDFENEAVKSPPAISPEAAQAAFDRLWESFDHDYAMFILRPEVDWAKLREEYRPKALRSRSTEEFSEVCAAMLKPLRDLHVWLTVSGENVPVFNRPRTSNSNPSAHQRILGSLHHEKSSVQWAVTDDKIGFIAIYAWNSAQVPAQCQEALEKMRDTRGLIVDVRLNGGGSEDQAMEFTGRFLNNEFIYAYDQERNGSPEHANLTPKTPRRIQPSGPWRYDRPVILLIGQKCMSSNESFIGMMTGDPLVTTMGDHTCGSSGNPEIISLPLEMTVSVPRWIDYLPDGSPLDERGFQPQVAFSPDPGAFETNRDDLLTAALDRLRKAPLPATPIAGPSFLSDQESEAQDESRPKVISVSPADGAQAVEPITELRVRFDRPMDPLDARLEWKSGGILECDFPQYDAQRHEFTIPVRLVQGMAQQVVVNDILGPSFREARSSFPRRGFQSADHRLARLFAWKFRTKDAPPVPPGAKPPKVLKISPAPDSVVPYRTFLEVQFDQPMKSPVEALPYMKPDLIKGPGFKEPSLICQASYDPLNHSFRLPLMLFPEEASSFALTGFYSQAGMPPEPIELRYQVSDQALAPAEQAEVEAERNNPKLAQALLSIQRKRAQLKSIAERVQTLSLSRRKGLFASLRAEGASFKWQQPDKFYADIADVMGMCSLFSIGSDGQTAWWLSVTSHRTNFVVCPAKEIQRLNLSFCDPFNLTQATPAQAATNWNLNYLGPTNLASTPCQLFQGWDIDDSKELTSAGITPIGSSVQWWVDSQSGRPLGCRTYSDGLVQRVRFLSDAINEPIPIEDFAAPTIPGLAPTPPEPFDADYTNRFIIVRDGSDGRMHVRFGKTGPKGRSSSGLN